MVLEGLMLTWYELIIVLVVIPASITIPLTIWLTKIKSSVDRNDRCITRLENKIDQQNVKIETVKNALDVDIRQMHVDIAAMKENMVEGKEIHKEIRDEMKDLRSFFVDWIQRVEDLNIPRK